MTNIAPIPTPANNSCRLAKKKLSSNLYSAHIAEALYTMMIPIVSKPPMEESNSQSVFGRLDLRKEKPHFLGLELGVRMQRSG